MYYSIIFEFLFFFVFFFFDLRSYCVKQMQFAQKYRNPDKRAVIVTNALEQLATMQVDDERRSER
jgi:hypothetical protein